MPRTIPEIDKDITALHRELRRRQGWVKPLSASDWQAAWDREPAMCAADTFLFAERGYAQVERDKRAQAAFVKEKRATRARIKKCPTCGFGPWRPNPMSLPESFLGDAPTPGPVAIPTPREQTTELLAALKAAAGYLTNAKIDLETGAPKRSAIQTIEGGLKVVRAAIEKAEGR